MPWRKAAAACDAQNNRSARLALPPKPGAADTLPIPGASPPRQRAWGRGGGRWGMSAARRTSPPLQRWWRGWRWRRRWRTVEAAAAAAAAVAASAVTAAAAAAATPRVVGSALRAVAGGRAARGGGGQDDTCTREGGEGVRQREGAQARPLGADGEEGRRAGSSPAVHSSATAALSEAGAGSDPWRQPTARGPPETPPAIRRRRAEARWVIESMMRE